ncbi:hypothetical protein BASA81_002233 [Batrachochytrium salamandrivorans]|nr:hypothetical protein BASA81_002233 [Batrachochytrium salamandrivorans]
MANPSSSSSSFSPLALEVGWTRAGEWPKSRGKLAGGVKATRVTKKARTPQNGRDNEAVFANRAAGQLRRGQTVPLVHKPSAAPMPTFVQADARKKSKNPRKRRRQWGEEEEEEAAPCES